MIQIQWSCGYGAYLDLPSAEISADGFSGRGYSPKLKISADGKV